MQLIPILPLSPSAKLLTMPTSSSSSSSLTSFSSSSSSSSSSWYSLHLPFTVGKMYLILTTLYLVVTNVTGSSQPNDAFINSASIASSSLSSDSSSSSIPSSLLSSSSLPSSSSSESSPMVQFNSPVAVLTSSVSSSSSGIRNSNINKRSASNSASSPGHSTSNTVLFKGDAIIESESLTPGTTSMSVFEGDPIILLCRVKSNESESVDIQWRVQPEDLSDEPSLLTDFGINDATFNSSVKYVEAVISNAPNRIDGTNSGSGANGGGGVGGNSGGRGVGGSGSSGASASSSGDGRGQQHQQQQSKLKITESQLYIKSATYSHRAHYSCLIDRQPTPISQQPRVLIRVKDRLAALWPFLGIVGEVVILCTVIFIYESKRTKAEEEDLDDTSASSPTRNAPGHSSTK